MKVSPRRRLINLLIFIPIWLTLMAFTFNVVKTYKVISASMEPTMLIGERFIVLQTRNFERDDIVVFTDPKDEDQSPIVKRAIGIPGDIIDVKKQEVFVNGEPHIPYQTDARYYMFSKVGQNEVFLSGDNQVKSYDSFVEGPINISAVSGRVLFRVWPLIR